MSNEPLAVNEPTAARMLAISPRKLFTLRTAGKIPHVRIDGRVVYSVVGLQEYLARNQVITASAGTRDAASASK